MNYDYSYCDKTPIELCKTCRRNLSLYQGIDLVAVWFVNNDWLVDGRCNAYQKKEKK